MIDRISQEKGISKEEAKVRLEAKLKEIAQKKGITVEELKKRMAEGKCCKGHGKMDEAKLKEIAEKKGITVEELKQRIEEHHSNKEKALQ
jgi:predicted DNA-binding ribbon-helix-helix protein